ncbi:MAG: RluA family pseudouridine synthase [Pseudomonadota bacterium]
MAETLSTGPDEAGMRLDRWLRTRFPALTQGALQKLLRTGQVRVDGARAKAQDRLKAGQKVRIPPQLVHSGEEGPPRSQPDPRQRRSDASELADMTLYEDKDILILNKPAGLAVQGGSKTRRHIDGMLAALEKHGERPRLVHRLDRDTSGVLVCAKKRSGAAALGKALAGRQVDKIYWAVVAGVPQPDRGTIDLPLVKSPMRGQDKVRPASRGEEGAQTALTHYAVADHAAATAALVVLRPVTGRQHQLRVHMAEIGCPILGDIKYGAPEAMPGLLAKQLHLHARMIRFRHPKTAAPMEVTAPLPPHLDAANAFFGFSAADQDSAMLEVLDQ